MQPRVILLMSDSFLANGEFFVCGETQNYNRIKSQLFHPLPFPRYYWLHSSLFLSHFLFRTVLKILDYGKKDAVKQSSL